MIPFNQHNDYIRVQGTDKDYVLNSALGWDIGKKGGKTEIIPAGYIFQVSSPKFYDWLQSKIRFLPDLAHHRFMVLPSAVHDWFLDQGYDLPFSSGEFRRAIRASGGGTLFAIAAYIATLIWTVIGRKIIN